jgi:putative addiction module component (TIGR02574 family)
VRFVLKAVGAGLMPPCLGKEEADGFDPDARVDEAASLTEAQRRELERRLAGILARPDAERPWEEVKAAALARSSFPGRGARD